MANMSNRLAIITGVSRKKGIGCAIADALAQDGVDIFFTYYLDYDRQMPWGVEDDEPQQIKQMILGRGVQCHCEQIDFARADAAQMVIDSVIEHMGYPDILINNATYSTNQSYETMTAQELDRHYRVNIRTATLLCTLFGQMYQKEHRGKIINISSGQFQGPMKDELSYVTTKGGMDALTISLADGLSERNICVNSVNPGPVDTGWMTDQLQEMLLPRFPFGRVGQPSDVANLVDFLVSERGDWITGQLLHSEGGFRRW